MNYRRYTFPVPFGAIAENLVNSLDHSIAVPEHLASTSDLAGFLQQHGIEWSRRITHADLEEVRALREDVRELFKAETPAKAPGRRGRPKKSQ